MSTGGVVRLRPAAAPRPAAAAPAAAAAPPAGDVAMPQAVESQVWVAVGAGGLRQDGLPAVEEILGRGIVVQDVNTGQQRLALVDICCLDRRSNTWFRLDADLSNARPMPPLNWRHVRGRWVQMPPPQM